VYCFTYFWIVKRYIWRLETKKENILQMKKTTKDLRYEILKFGYVHNIYMAY